MSIAVSYARALYEAAQETKASPAALDQLEAQIGFLSAVIESSRDLSIVLLGPITTAPEKMSFIHELSKKQNFSPLLVRFIELLIKKRRLSGLREIGDAFRSVRLLLEGGLAGQLETAEPLSEPDLDQLVKAFSQKFGKKINFQISTDPALLAGIKVTVNGVTYDGTLRSQLQKLRERVSAGLPVAHA